MWKRVEVVATIEHPVELVFDYLADPLKWHEFAPAVVLRRQIDEGQSRIGTRWLACDRVGPFRLHFVDELAGHEPNRRVAWDSSSPWNSRVEYLCEQTGTGTLVRASYEGDVDGWLRMLSWAPASMIGFFLARDFKRLQSRLDAIARAAVTGQERPSEVEA
ncbi:MAG: SRPBCC family protein [Candidatus Limnocylindrales bacterium]